ncbi:MAG: DNA-directed RNA polymerase subunit B', partial [Halobacteriales archaeon]
MTQDSNASVYINGSLVGRHQNPQQLATRIREARRHGELSDMVNVSVDESTNEVIVNADAGRARRPLLVIEDGEPLATQEEVEALKQGELEF